MPEAPEIRRLPNGAIDTRFYQRHVTKLRSAAAYDGLSSLACTMRRLMRWF